jgi:hypothetical protein
VPSTTELIDGCPERERGRERERERERERGGSEGAEGAED